jgi:hypothetical protein
MSFVTSFICLFTIYSIPPKIKKEKKRLEKNRKTNQNERRRNVDTGIFCFYYYLYKRKGKKRYVKGEFLSGEKKSFWKEFLFVCDVCDVMMMM